MFVFFPLPQGTQHLQFVLDLIAGRMAKKGVVKKNAVKTPKSVEDVGLLSRLYRLTYRIITFAQYCEPYKVASKVQHNWGGVSGPLDFRIHEAILPPKRCVFQKRHWELTRRFGRQGCLTN